MAKQFWVKTSGGVKGPFTGEQIKQFYAAGKLKSEHQISPDQEHWQNLGKVMSLPTNAGGAAQPGAKPASPKRRKPKLESIEDFEEDDDEIEDYGDGDADDEWGGYASPPVYGSLAPNRGTTQPTGGSREALVPAVLVFLYSFGTVMVVLVLLTSLLGSIGVTALVGASLIDPFDRDSMSPKTALALGYLVSLVYQGLLLGLVVLAKRAVPIWGAIVIGVCALFGLGMFIESLAWRETMGNIIRLSGQLSQIAMYAALSGVTVAWLICLATPAAIRMPAYFGAWCPPLFAYLYWSGAQGLQGQLQGRVRQGGNEVLMLLAATLLLAVCYLAMTKFCQRVAVQSKSRRVQEEADGVFVHGLVSFGIVLFFAILTVVLPASTLMSLGVYLLFGIDFALIYITVKTVDLLSQVRGLV